MPDRSESLQRRIDVSFDHAGENKCAEGLVAVEIHRRELSEDAKRRLPSCCAVLHCRSCGDQEAKGSDEGEDGLYCVCSKSGSICCISPGWPGTFAGGMDGVRPTQSSEIADSPELERRDLVAGPDDELLDASADCRLGFLPFLHTLP